MRYEWKWRRVPPDGANRKATNGSDGRTVKGVNVAWASAHKQGFVPEKPRNADGGQQARKIMGSGWTDRY